LGLNQFFTATGNFTDGGTTDLTDTVVWASSDTTKVTISNVNNSRGRAKTVAVGTVTISATMGALVGNTLFTVAPAQLLSITVTPANSTVAKGLPQQFTATGNYTNGPQNLTAVVLWESTVTTVAQISNAAGSQGSATTLAIGSTVIRATYLGIVGQTNFTVDKPAVTGVILSPLNQTVVAGTKVQYALKATYTDGTMPDVTTSATWTTSDQETLPISTGGLASTRSPGNYTVTGAFGGFSATTPLTVTAPVLLSIAITPVTATINLQATQQYVAIGTYDNGDQPDITGLATWNTSAPTIATFPFGVDGPGLAQASSLNAGATTITASYDGKTSNNATLTVAILKRYAFVTSSTYNGNRGGLAGADAICNAHGQKYLPGTYKAWLSTSVASPASRFVQSTVPYVLPNELQVASNWTALTSGTLQRAINVTEQASAAPASDAPQHTDNVCSSASVFTATTSAGFVELPIEGPVNTCSDWTSNSPNFSSSLGSSSSATASWTDDACIFYLDCGGVTPIYCFQQ
jgi:hypothetical protein